MPQLYFIIPVGGDGSGAGGAHPSHPIMLPGMPGWGSGGPPLVPSHPIVIPPDSIGPGVPTHPIFIPVYPSHPIVIPPDAIGPGQPEHPIVIPPPYPSHPIVIPPESVGPGLPEHPIVLPPPTGGGGPVDPGYSPPWAQVPVDPGYGIDVGLKPTHPIVIPPDAIIPDTEGNAHVVVYVNTAQGPQRITFSVDMEGGLKPPTHPQPK